MELALRLTPAGSVSVHERRLELATSLELTGELERGAAVLEEICETAPDDDLRACPALSLHDRLPPGRRVGVGRVRTGGDCDCA
jgi:hypothetical protein